MHYFIFPLTNIVSIFASAGVSAVNICIAKLQPPEPNVNSHKPTLRKIAKS